MNPLIPIAFNVINALWPYCLIWFVLGAIGHIVGIIFGIFDWTTAVTDIGITLFGPLTLIAVIAFLVDARKKSKP